MKNIHHLLLTSLALLIPNVTLFAKTIPGPQGGRILTAEAPYAEFFVQPDRTVLVSFYDKDLKPVVPSGQVVTATAEASSGKVKLEFTAKNGTLVSTTPLPEGDGYRVVVQIRDSAEAKPKNYRLEYHGEMCAECQRAEYACTCDGHGGEAGHAH